jgi:bacteriorhodopsin
MLSSFYPIIIAVFVGGIGFLLKTKYDKTNWFNKAYAIVCVVALLFLVYSGFSSGTSHERTHAILLMVLFFPLIYKNYFAKEH